MDGQYIKERIESSTADYKYYVEENFQLTLGEAIMGIRYTNEPQKLSYTSILPKVKLTTIDGELHILNEKTPPGLKHLSKKSKLFQARGK